MILPIISSCSEIASDDSLEPVMMTIHVVVFLACHWCQALPALHVVIPSITLIYVYPHFSLQWKFGMNVIELFFLS
jgi:hypothetical protein